jgi:hypothetical protein
MIASVKYHLNPPGALMNRPPADDQFSQRVSHYLLPVVFGMAAWMAQRSYTDIKAQLDRIELRQQSDNVAIAELQLRVLHLERLTGNNPAPAEKQRPPINGAK